MPIGLYLIKKNGKHQNAGWELWFSLNLELICSHPSLDFGKLYMQVYESDPLGWPVQECIFTESSPSFGRQSRPLLRPGEPRVEQQYSVAAQEGASPSRLLARPHPRRGEAELRLASGARQDQVKILPKNTSNYERKSVWFKIRQFCNVSNGLFL